MDQTNHESRRYRLAIRRRRIRARAAAVGAASLGNYREVSSVSVHYDQVVASYHRCRESAGFFDTFYDLLLGKSAEIAGMFVNTDFKRQKLMLRESLIEVLNLYCGVESVREEILALGRRHVELKVRPAHFELWLDALCEAIERHDPEYEPGLKPAWRAALRPAIDLMLSVR